MEAEALIHREEVTATMMLVADIHVTLREILTLLEDTLGEDQEEDA